MHWYSGPKLIGNLQPSGRGTNQRNETKGQS